MRGSVIVAIFLAYGMRAVAGALDAAALDRAIAELAARAEPGRLGVGVMDLATGETWFLNGDARFPMQSMFKAPLAAAVLAAVDEGRMSLDDSIEIAERDLSPPYSDVSASWPERTRYTVRELVERAAGRSDNTAADVLTERLGGPQAVTKWLRAKGVPELRLDRLEREFQVELSAMGPFRPEWRTEEAYEAALRAVPEEQRRRALQAYLKDPRDTTTPRSAVTFLAKLERGELLSKESTELLLRIMTETGTGRNRLKAGLPAGSRLAHKTGTGRRDLGIAPAVNDMGIATLPDGRRLIVVATLSGATAELAACEAILADAARAAVAASYTSGP